MTMDFSGVVKTFTSRYPLVILRDVGTYVNGVHTADLQKVRETTGAVQTTSGKQLIMVPENYREERTLTFYFFDPELMEDDPYIKLNDFVDYRQKRYKIITSQPYDNISNYVMAIGVRVEL